MASDKQKARSLKQMAEITLQRLKETKIKKYPSNSLVDYYDILRKLMEALCDTDGVKFRGEGAHSKIIDYVCQKYKFGEAKRVFLQQLRDYRNRISYEGFNIAADYITDNQDKIELIITSLMRLVNAKTHQD